MPQRTAVVPRTAVVATRAASAALVLVAASMLAACSRPARPADERPAPSPAPPSSAPAHADAGAADAGAANAGAADAGALAIVDAPMAWSDERARLTLEYRRTHSDPSAKDLTIEPRVIVLHYTAGSSAAATRAYFDQPRIEKQRAELARHGAVNVSSHFLVDRDGTIYRLQPETRFARHCIGLNHIAIGIENVGDDKQHPLTAAQVAADAALVRDLAHRFPITHLLGHHEVMRFRDHPYYVERDASYRNDKPDPGDAFMARVRAQVADLHLEGPPAN